MDLDGLALLVASHAGDAVAPATDGKVTMSYADGEAVLFGIYEMRRRIAKLRADFEKAYSDTPDKLPMCCPMANPG